MRNQNKSIFIFLQIAFQPHNMIGIQIVRWLIQKQDIRFFQKELCQKELGTLSTGKICYISVQIKLQQIKCPCHLFDFTVDHIKIMTVQKILQRSHFFQKLCHLRLICLCKQITDLCDPCFHFKQKRISRL